MGMSYGGEYQVKVRVKREELGKMEEAVKKVISEYKNNPPSYLSDRMLEFRISDIKHVLNAIEKEKNRNEDYALLDIGQDVDDCTHNFFGEYMLPIQKAAPDMEIAVKAYFSSDWPWSGYAYKSAEDDPLPFGDDMDFGSTLTDSSVFPEDADWIPTDWREPLNESEEKFSESVRSITFGHYKGKPIEWFVLKDSNGMLKLVSKYGLEEKRYHEEDEMVTWEECSLRAWLNDTFLNQAFTKEEQEAIVLSELYNDFFGAGFDPAQEDTEDKVFLLSTVEWIQGFWGGPGYDPLPEPEYRGGISVPCGKCRAVDDEETYEVSYWLRTGEVVDSFECLTYDECYDQEYFVRPVLCLDQSKAEAFIKTVHEGNPATYY